MSILFITLFVLNIVSITLSIMNLRRIKKYKENYDADSN